MFPDAHRSRVAIVNQVVGQGRHRRRRGISVQWRRRPFSDSQPSAVGWPQADPALAGVKDSLEASNGTRRVSGDSPIRRLARRAQPHQVLVWRWGAIPSPLHRQKALPPPLRILYRGSSRQRQIRQCVPCLRGSRPQAPSHQETPPFGAQLIEGLNSRQRPLLRRYADVSRPPLRYAPIRRDHHLVPGVVPYLPQRSPNGLGVGLSATVNHGREPPHVL